MKDEVTFDEFLDACSKVSMPDLEDLMASKATGKRGSKGSARQKLEQDLRHADVLREGGTIYYLRELKA